MGSDRPSLLCCLEIVLEQMVAIVKVLEMVAKRVSGEQVLDE